MAIPDKFRFRKHDSIGAPAAENDQKFLENCFIETGDSSILLDCSDPKSIITGRTGSGKTALLQYIHKIEDRTIEVKPESLALAYVSNSTILNYVSSLGVKLDIFFRLLWRHVFTVEILKYHFNIKDESAKASFKQKLKSLFRDDKHTKAIDYLETWGKSFWEETEYRIKEVTSTLESNIEASIRGKVPPLAIQLGGAEKLTDEVRREVVQRAQHVVNEVQIRQLSDIIDLIDDVLVDRQKRYYITIDKLDESWVDDSIRYKLIRALIETVRDFQKIRYVKIIVAMRLDLLDMVFKLTRDAGFQEEKYESIIHRLSWTKKCLISVLDNRIDCLIKQTYTSKEVSYKDILPKKIGGEEVLDYMFKRTFLRPRDVIMFFNFCINRATEKPKIAVQMIRDAEGEYSRSRLRNISDEWGTHYPEILHFVDILKSQKKHFKLEIITDELIDNLCYEYIISASYIKSPLAKNADQVLKNELTTTTFKQRLFHIFYRVGIIDIKLSSFEGFSGVQHGRPTISSTELVDSVNIAIHPMFWRVLGTKEQ